jgi:hypothetical protein
VGQMSPCREGGGAGGRAPHLTARNASYFRFFWWHIGIGATCLMHVHDSQRTVQQQLCMYKTVAIAQETFIACKFIRSAKLWVSTAFKAATNCGHQETQADHLSVWIRNKTVCAGRECWAGIPKCCRSGLHRQPILEW